MVHGDDGVKDALQDSSNFYKLSQGPPPDGEALAQRLTADFAPILDTLWGSGYYDARIFASVGATQLELGQTEGEPVARAANAYRNRAVVPITITVETGVLFRLRNIAVVDASTYEPFPSEILPPYVLELQPGDPAKAADLRAANARLIDYFRAQSHPLVKAPLPHATVNHALLTMDVTFSVDPVRKPVSARFRSMAPTVLILRSSAHSSTFSRVNLTRRRRGSAKWRLPPRPNQSSPSHEHAPCRGLSI